MEVFGVMSPPYSSIFRSSDQCLHFHRGVNRANYGLTANNTRQPSRCSRRELFTSPSRDIRFKYSPTIQAPNLEPLDLRTVGGKDKPEQQTEAFEGNRWRVSGIFKPVHALGTDSLAKFSDMEIRKCFTSAHKVKEEWSSNFNEKYVYTNEPNGPRVSKETSIAETSAISLPATVAVTDQLSPFMMCSSIDSSPPPLMIDLSRNSSDNEMNSSKESENAGVHSTLDPAISKTDRRSPKADQRSPSMLFSSLDSSPSALMIDFSRSVLNAERDSSKTDVHATPDPVPAKQTFVKQSQHVYDFESDEELHALGPFAKFRSHAAPLEIRPQESPKNTTSPQEFCVAPCALCTNHASLSSSDMEITRDIKALPSNELSSGATSLSNTMCQSVMSHSHNTQDYNADISVTHISGSASVTSTALSSDNHAPTWFVKQSTQSSPLKIKLCKTFTVNESSQSKQGGQDRVAVTTGFHDACSLGLFVDSQHSGRQSFPDADVTLCPETSCPRLITMDVTERLVEGRSIDEASTILNASSSSADTTPRSHCVSRPLTPDVSFHVFKIPKTPKHNHIMASQRSSTPNAREQEVRKKVCDTGAIRQDDYVQESSLRKALLKKKIAAQGSDSILNLGFTSELELEPQDVNCTQDTQRFCSGVAKKTKSKWLKKTSIFKALRQKLACQSNTSLMSLQEHSMLPELSCSERIKAALEPLTTIAKSTKPQTSRVPSLPIPLCGKTSTTGTSIASHAAISDTKQEEILHQAFGAEDRESSGRVNLPNLKIVPSVRSLGTSTSILETSKAPVDLSVSNAPMKTTETQLRRSSIGASIQNVHPSAFASKTSGNNFFVPQKSFTASSAVDNSPFKVPNVPRVSRGRLQVQKLRGGEDSRASSIYPGCETGMFSRTATTESSMSESNVLTWTTQQALDIQAVKYAARSVAELLIAFIEDADIIQFGTQFNDALSKSMLASLCERCEIRIKESKVHNSVVMLVKSQRSRAPTEADVKHLIRRARRTRNPSQSSSAF